MPPGRSAAAALARRRPCRSARRSSARGDLRQRASGREASVPSAVQGASTRTRSKPGRHLDLGRVGLDHGDAAQAEPSRLGGDLGRPGGIELDRDRLAAVASAGGDLAGLDPRPGAEVEDVLARLRIEHLEHGGGAAALRGQLAGARPARGRWCPSCRRRPPAPAPPAATAPPPRPPRRRPPAAPPGPPRDRCAAC